ncbi:FUSC family protein [Paraburkholderia caribensis]|uniref:FUSC family protein n=1 Tax=Paraburkholderia caribensis TaxID=75105 RepID=UPI00078B9E2E|nr:FUSC family protein [Paraburkholderia caribensis]AMV48437.1 hypothetical protein ATN79_48175 [Paraburkholderia caribensis]
MFALKAAIAAALAVGVSMLLDLPQPKTAMVSVFIVMRPHTGLVLARSFYRLAGTLAGVTAAIVLISLFGQHPDLFIISASIWIAFCTFGAALDRNTRSYGFVLAGYTAAIVGAPALQDPTAIFSIATTRVAEISIAIICSSAVSALVVPVHASDEIEAIVRDQYRKLFSFIAQALPLLEWDTDLDQLHLSLIPVFSAFDSLRVVAALETHRIGGQSRRLRRLNVELMTASTRLHTLLQFKNQLAQNGQFETLRMLKAALRGVSKLRISPPDEQDNRRAAVSLSVKVVRFRTMIRRRIALAKPSTVTSNPTVSRDFDTAAHLIDRFGNDLSAYLDTSASLYNGGFRDDTWSDRIVPRTDPAFAAAAGVRAAVAALMLGFFWIGSAWPSGGVALAQGVAICALASTSPNPAKLALQIAIGTALGSIVGGFLVFGIYPRIDGLPLLAYFLIATTAPGAYLMTRQKYAGIGIGYCVFMPVLAGPDNVQTFRPEGYLNDALALIIAMLAAYFVQCVVFPVSAKFFRRRLASLLRRQIRSAYQDPLEGLRTRFETTIRDILVQQLALSKTASAADGDAASLFNAVLEIGSSIIDAREAASKIASGHWCHEARRTSDTLSSVVALFDGSETGSYDRAQHELNQSIEALELVLASGADEECKLSVENLVKQLNLIRRLIGDVSPSAIAKPELATTP